MNKRLTNEWLCLCLALVTMLLTACSKERPRYVIGVSQCSEDIWRHKLNDELRMGTYFHDGVELRLASADDSDERQIAQIDSLVQSGVDLLIVAPNQAARLTPAIDRAYDKGIPVIVFDRKTNSQKFTAYIGADNEEMGRQMGEYIASQQGGRGRVLEIMGLRGSSPAIERHRGFVSAISRYPGIELVASLQGDWTEESAVEAIRQYDGDLSTIDFVFGQNDRMALGARRALLKEKGTVKSEKGKVKNEKFATATESATEESAEANFSLFTLPSTLKFCGIDGLPGEGGGLACVRDSVLDATYIYPTRGDEVLQLAIDILEGKPYKKENMLMAALVTPDNARIALMQAEETQRRSSYLESLGERTDVYLQQLATQRTIIILAGVAFVLLLLTALFYLLYRKGKISLRRQRVVSTLWSMEDDSSKNDTPQNDSPPTPPCREGSGQNSDTPTTTESIDSLPSQGKEGGESSPVESLSLFITRFKEVIERRLSDSELSVEDLAAEMNLSRVQLYRKVKNISGSSPVELLRTARLNRGYQLLLTTDKTVSEVAYAVGFTAPSYFTKCFKDEFGKSPSELA